jgi:hypothetical protein
MNWISHVGPIEVEATPTGCRLSFVDGPRRRLITADLPGANYPCPGVKAKPRVDLVYNHGIGVLWAQRILEGGTRFNPSFELFLNEVEPQLSNP